MTTLRDLLAETARQHDCTVEALKGPARRPELIAARWDFVRRAWQEGRWTTTQIGDAINRDRTIVLYARMKAAE